MGGDVTHPKAINVLKGIANHAKLEVVSLQYPATSSAGKRTTKHKKFVPIWDFEQLVKAADTVAGAIDLFGDSSRRSDQKAWMLKKAAKQAE